MTLINEIKIQEYSCQREKYKNGFKESLKASQEMVNFVVSYLQHHNFLVHPQNDATPHILPNGDRVRLYDIQAIDIDSPSKAESKFEVKDFSRLLYYNSTGLPRDYVKKMIKYVGAENLYIIFSDNAKYVSEKSKKDNISEEAILEQLSQSGATVKHDDKWYFVPYGNRLDILMDEAIDQRATERVKSNLSSYKGQVQYIWKMEHMLPIPNLLKKIKSHVSA